MECRYKPRLKMGMLELTREGFSDGSDGKESAYNAGDLSLISGSGRSPGRGHGNPLSCLENPPGQRNLVDYSPWGHKKSDMTEGTNIFTFTERIKLKPGR